MHAAKLIFRKEGCRGFMKGVWPRVITIAPEQAISWTAYELMKRLL